MKERNGLLFLCLILMAQLVMYGIAKGRLQARIDDLPIAGLLYWSCPCLVCEYV
jgi:hypothetical protein